MNISWGVLLNNNPHLPLSTFFGRAHSLGMIKIDLPDQTRDVIFMCSLANYNAQSWATVFSRSCYNLED